MKALGIAGYSGSGKTTLIERLLPRLASAGLAVSVIKQSHHDFEVDRPGKDSWRHRQAGAREVLLGACRT
jgi:molybdopterin-guanine dinucleotide biosynthesis protein B